MSADEWECEAKLMRKQRDRWMWLYWGYFSISSGVQIAFYFVARAA
jgi:hypothetical protein